MKNWDKDGHHWNFKLSSEEQTDTVKAFSALTLQKKYIITGVPSSYLTALINGASKFILTCVFKPFHELKKNY